MVAEVLRILACLEPERKNEAASADAAVKKGSVGVPWRQLMEDLGYSPAQIDRMEVMRAADAMRTAILASTSPSPSGGAPPARDESRPAVPAANGSQPAPANA